MRVAVIGAGNMGSALIRGIVASGLCHPQDVMAADSSAARLAAITLGWGLATSRGGRIRTTRDNRAAAAWGGLVVLAVKPVDLDAVLREIRPALSARHLLVSIAAGVPLARIRRLVGPLPVLVRALPNLPAIVGEAMTAISSESGRSGRRGTRRGHLTTATRLFRAVGRVVVVDEKHLHAVTGLSGSGPAYLCLVVEALARAGSVLGLPRALALGLATQTALGTARLLREQGEPPERVIARVASPGGTTVAGLRVLEQGKVGAHLTRAVVAAARRSRALGGGR